jgi:hypothetical protein
MQSGHSSKLLLVVVILNTVATVATPIVTWLVN